MKKILYISVLFLSTFIFNIDVFGANSLEQCKWYSGSVECNAEVNCKWVGGNQGCIFVDPNINPSNDPCTVNKDEKSCKAQACYWDPPNRKCYYNSVINTSTTKVMTPQEAANCGQYYDPDRCENGNSACEWDPANNVCIYSPQNDSTDTSNCGILGGFKEDLENILKAIRIVAPVLVAFLSAYEYLSVVFMKSADDMKKANKRLINRLILIAILFFLPTLLNLILSLIETGDYNTCIK